MKNILKCIMCVMCMLSGSIYAQGNPHNKNWGNPSVSKIINEYTNVINNYDNDYDNAIAMNTALSNIPSISHVGKHSHSSWAVAIGKYNESSSVAFAFQHMQDKSSFKTSVAASDKDISMGIGFGHNF